MGQKAFAICNKEAEDTVKSLTDAHLFDKIFTSDDLMVTEDILQEIISIPFLSDYFYIVRFEKEIIFNSPKFAFVPPVWDKTYVHTWNNESIVRLYNTEHVKNNPEHYTDKNFFSGKIEIKNISERIYTEPLFDIVYLSYDEFYADENYHKIKLRFPRAKRVHGVKGIFEAHKEAAKLAETPMVYIVDADAEILPDFNFDYNPGLLDKGSVHIWHSRNPINDLEYGYGGVKMFPTSLLLSFNKDIVDFTTSVSKSIKVIPEVSNITKFNVDPFSTWRSAFRECAKLSSRIIYNQDNNDTEERLRIWCSIGEDREFGDFAIMGAKEGRDFGLEFANQPEVLGLINNFEWLEKKFSN